MSNLWIAHSLPSLLVWLASLAAVPAPRGDLPAGPDVTLTPVVRNEILEKCIATLRERYVFPEVAKKMEQAIRERMASKEYDAITSSRALADELTEELRAVSNDLHLRVRFENAPGTDAPARRAPDETDFAAERAREALMNFGFERVERLHGNVGYLDLRQFGPQDAIADTAAAAMTFLANTDALIIDLRENGGGAPGGVALLCSYLFGETPVHLNDMYHRPSDETTEFWTEKHVAGKRYLDRDVFVLTSRDTFSAAEEFAYNLKHLKRAQIVGERSGGGAHPGESRRLSPHFRMFVPTGRAINPITKSNWEGTGVAPDVDVPASIALKTAHKLALEKLIPKTKDVGMRERRAELVAELERDIGARASSATR